MKTICEIRIILATKIAILEKNYRFKILEMIPDPRLFNFQMNYFLPNDENCPFF